MAIKKYYDSDCNLGVLDGKTVAVKMCIRDRRYSQTDPHRKTDFVKLAVMMGSS